MNTKKYIELFRERFPELFIKVGGKVYSTGQGISNIYEKNESYSIEQFLTTALEEVERDLIANIIGDAGVIIRMYPEDSDGYKALVRLLETVNHRRMESKYTTSGEEKE